MSGIPVGLVSIAKLKLIRDSAEIEADIARRAPGWVYELYDRFKNRAAEAMAAFVTVDSENAPVIRELQLELKLFDAFCTEVHGIIKEGIEADRAMTEDDRAEILDALMMQPDGDKIAAEVGLVDNVKQID